MVSAVRVMVRMIGSKFCFLLAFASVGMACSREYYEHEADDAGQGQVMTVMASICDSPSTRTSLQGNGDGYYVVWNDGDKILIGGKEFTLVSDAGSTCGEFAGPQLEDGVYDAYFATRNGEIPTTQTFTAGKISNAPMAAKLTVSDGKSGPISFKNLGGLLRITIRNIQKARVKSIALSISGHTSSMRLVLDCGNDGVELSEEGTEFYIAVPEDTYRSVSVDVSDGNTTVTKTLDAFKTLNISRSKITNAAFTGRFEGKSYHTYHKGHEYVDLGLPSGLMWATCNLGADKPWEGGSIFTWDEAVVDWGGDWRLPTVDEMNELLTSANWGVNPYVDYRGVKGYYAKNNGKYNCCTSCTLLGCISLHI
mgnify:CR=1 FL=1